MKKILIFKLELYLQVSRSEEQLGGTAPGCRRGRAGEAPAARRNTGLGRAAAGDPSRPRVLLRVGGR